MTAVKNNVRSGEWGLSLGALLLPASRATALFTLPAVLLILAAGMTIGTLHDRADFLGNLAELVPWGRAQPWLLQTVVLPRRCSGREETSCPSKSASAD